MGSQEEEIPFWHVNIPEAQRVLECPEFLATLSEKDRQIISTPDAQFHILSWPEVQHLIATNRLDLFERIPSNLRRYFEFNWKLKQEYGSVMQFILSQRLHWEMPIEARAAPFQDLDDLKILRNDWPYGVASSIVHLVVWTKFELEPDPVTDDLTDHARKEIDDFVREKFSKRVGEDNVIWFKNWKALKSVHAVEHFHVMLNNPDPEFVKEITAGDIPMSQKI
ncbi:hypothetical protein OIDMADRAFT_18213 [Oidiodendron maius Zn]|uniref:N-acetylglucosamine-induced protein 1 n=1 Tax=Oidiodendron maius (strain Zn) TaxID=913774 RepID=A0A0C3H7J9_OIDMZ|nr:hypothetical protein OIDMADRAFT_18213 [Oidiodendron maius Zn]